MRGLWIIGLLFASPALATDYFVRTDGSDANAGTGNSAAQAWASPARCASTTVKAGDRCLIQPGTYYLASGVTQANGGALKADNAMSSCTCTAKSTTISCGATVGGRWSSRSRRSPTR